MIFAKPGRYAAEVAVDAPGLAIWNAAAVAVIVEEAGGHFDRRVSSNGLLTRRPLSALR